MDPFSVTLSYYLDVPVTRSGQYLLSVNLGGDELPGSPYTFQVRISLVEV